MSTFTSRGAEDFVRSWESAGLDEELVAPVRDAVARASEIAAEAGKMMGGVAGYQAQVIDRLVAGEITFLEATIEWDGLARVLQKPSTSINSNGNLVADAARKEVLRSAKRYLDEKASELAQVADDGGAPYIREALEELDVLRPERVRS